VEVRAYTAADARGTSAVFLRAVRETARVHYSSEQVEAWAAEVGDLDSWAAARTAAQTHLAVAVARHRGLPALTTFASLTSRPVFERHGFVITGERYFGEGDQAAKTFAMRCRLSATTSTSTTRS
jgi:putative acetyltransferase